MKVVYIVALLACVVAVQSQVLPGIGLGGFGGFGGLGPAGLPGLPIIPPIIPPFLGFPFFRPFFGLRRFGLLGMGLPFLGKRDTENVEKVEKVEIEKIGEKVDAQRGVEATIDGLKKADEADNKVARSMNSKVEKVDKIEKVEKVEGEKLAARGVDADKVDKVEKVKKMTDKVEKMEREVAEPETVCTLSTEDNMLRCRGASAAHTFKCQVVPQIGELSSVELRIQDLDIIRREGETDILRLVAPRTQITAVNPKTKEDIVVALFSGKQTAVQGFQVVEEACWRQVGSLVSDLRPEELRLSLTIAPRA